MKHLLRRIIRFVTLRNTVGEPNWGAADLYLLRLEEASRRAKARRAGRS